jgi:peptide chain release factor 1
MANEDPMRPSLGNQLREMSERLDAIDAKIVDPEVMSQGPLYAALLKERGRLLKVVEPYRAWREARDALDEARGILEDPHADAELKALAELEIDDLESRCARLRDAVKRAAIREESAPDRNAIVEIRAGTGGEEAALFAADLLRMYSHYAEQKGWKINQMDARPTDLGGFKEVVFSVEGDGAYPELRWESGGHRVQRVPATETQGRIHTSLVTVAVLPEAEEVDVEIDPDDIEMTFSCASGPGGQKVNKTSSAVRLVHVPTGIEATCQETPSQHKNRAQAMRILRARIFEKEKREREAARAADRRSKIGSGDRNERIRTYNFPQNRVTDHRIGLTLHDLPGVLDGKMDDIFQALADHEIAEREEGLELE